MRKVAFAFIIVELVIYAICLPVFFWAYGLFGIIYLIPFAWLIPMAVHTYKWVNGEIELGLGFKICTLIFVSLISGILMLCDSGEKKPYRPTTTYYYGDAAGQSPYSSYCPHCGKGLKPDDLFCPHCGKSIADKNGENTVN